jgi:hypothetical protein
VVLDAIRGVPEEPGFPHRVHVVDEALDCGDCHLGAEDSEEPGIPPLMACLLCHEDTDADKPLERQAASFFDEEGFVASGWTTLSDEVRFSHLDHVTEYGLDCLQCHVGIDENEHLGPDDRIDMDACSSCHADVGVSSDCGTCHTEIDREWAPSSHMTQWQRTHGGVFLSDLGGTAQDCNLCHDDASCSTCHQITPPENHDEYFRLRGHWIHAQMDRDSCQVCHTTADFCVRCHEESAPLSHTGAFGSPMSMHCVGCHFPLQGETCFTCHKSATSHLALAAPKPADPPHLSGMSCRQCHGVGQPLPHPDKGDDCNLCHL